MTPLPPQTPLRRRHIPLRARTDVGRLPRFDAPRDPSMHVQRYEPNEPRDLEWVELRDPEVWVAAVGIVVGGVALCVFWFTA